MKSDWPQLGSMNSVPLMRVLNKLANVPAEVLAPAGKDVFNALDLTSPGDVKVIIIGQDPYIRGEAHGLAFSSQLGMTPSLEVIFNELERSGLHRSNPNLSDWAEQGVLLLNSILTTRRGVSLAHEKFGWQEFTKSIIQHVIYQENSIVVMLWGSYARDIWASSTKGIDVDMSHVKVLSTCHPIAEKRNGVCFTGCNHFVLANEWLIEHEVHPINWSDNGSEYNRETTERR